MKIRWLLLAHACACLLGLQTIADEEASESDKAEEAEVESLIVVGTRTERKLEEISATVTVIDADEIQERLVRNISDLVRYEPGVSVGGTGSRWGFDGFTIRGIGGNRVLTVIDGVRIPDEFSFGPFLSSRRDLVDLANVGRVEIARGPISSLYGSDALGGVVAITTKDPGTYLQDGETLGAFFNAGYSTADESTATNFNLASTNQSLDALLTVTSRKSGERENQGTNDVLGPSRGTPDPQSIDVLNVNGKVSFQINSEHLVGLEVEQYKNETDTNIYSDYGISVFGTVVDSRDSNDERDRTRFSVTYVHSHSSASDDQLVLRVFRQSSESVQHTFENRTSRGMPQTRLRASQFQQDTTGVHGQFTQRYSMNVIEHLVSVGVDYYQTDSESRRDGHTRDAMGNPVREFSILPTSDFPPTSVNQTAVFLQDEMVFLDGRFRLTPGVRWDRFDADATGDSLYFNGNPGAENPADFADSELTAKVGAVFFVSDLMSLYGRFSEGFRAPPYDDVNVGFTNFGGGYKTISNTELKSERSTGIELGLRAHGNFGNIQISAYTNNYDEFIESFALAPMFLRTGGIDPADGLRTFQSINRGEAEISGLEAKASIQLGSEYTIFNFAFATASGTDKVADAPLNSIDPRTAVLGLRHDAADYRWGFELVWTLVAAKKAGEIDDSAGRMPTSGYGVVDVLLHSRLGNRTNVNLGLFNVTDKRYIRWIDTNGIGFDNPMRFTQPGFNAGLNLSIEI